MFLESRRGPCTHVLLTTDDDNVTGHEGRAGRTGIVGLGSVFTPPVPVGDVSPLSSTLGLLLLDRLLSRPVFLVVSFPDSTFVGVP